MKREEIMKAQQIFEKLGYFKIEKQDTILYIDKVNFSRIRFNKLKKRYTVDEVSCVSSITIELHQAITEQIKELGWIE